MQEIGFLEVGGFQVGQAEDAQAGTGVTVLLFDECAPAGVDIRGGGPASRETPLLAPVADAAGLHALVLSGGSAFGLDAAGGVMRFLEERGIGFDTGITPVPLVAQSCIFDLAIGDKSVRPDGDSIYACSVGHEKADLNAVATLSSYVMAKAIGVGVRAARDGFGLPCAQTLGTV